MHLKRIAKTSAITSSSFIILCHKLYELKEEETLLNQDSSNKYTHFNRLRTNICLIINVIVQNEDVHRLENCSDIVASLCQTKNSAI